MVRKEGFLRSYSGNSSFIGFKEDQTGLERRGERKACNSKDRCWRLHCLDSRTGAGGFGHAEQYGEHVNLFWVFVMAGFLPHKFQVFGS